MHIYIYRPFNICIASMHLDQSGTGCRRCTGCPKMRVSFRKKAILYTTILRKMTYKLVQSAKDVLKLIPRPNPLDLKQNRLLNVSRLEFLYQQYFGFLLFSGSRNYPIVNLNSRKES